MKVVIVTVRKRYNEERNQTYYHLRTSNGGSEAKCLPDKVVVAMSYMKEALNKSDLEPLFEIED